MELSPEWQANSCSATQEIQYVMEPEGSVPCSQELSTATYPERDEWARKLKHCFRIHGQIIIWSRRYTKTRQISQDIDKCIFAILLKLQKWPDYLPYQDVRPK
jgi:hypothetical protein